MTIKELSFLQKKTFNCPHTSKEKELYPIILDYKLKLYNRFIADLKKLKMKG